MPRTRPNSDDDRTIRERIVKVETTQELHGKLLWANLGATSSLVIAIIAALIGPILRSGAHSTAVALVRHLLGL